MCLSATKDLANRWIDTVFPYSVTSHISWEGLLLFWGGYYHLPQKNLSIYIDYMALIKSSCYWNNIDSPYFITYVDNDTFFDERTDGET